MSCRRWFTSRPVPLSDMFWIEYWVVFFKSMLELIDTGRMSFCLFGTAFIWFTLLLWIIKGIILLFFVPWPATVLNW